MENQLNIIQACIKQDRKAQRLLFNQYAKWGLTICRRYVNSEEKAQEACNDGFMRVFTRMETFDASKGELKSWMARIFINCALSSTKKEAFNNSFSPLSELTLEPVSEEVFFKFDAEEILAFLKHMPMGYKTIFNMYVIDGYSHKEIGSALNISEITSRSQLRKAKLWIRENICLDTLKTRLES